MDVRALLLDAFGRVAETVHHVGDGLTPEQLTVRLDPDANSIAWLLWHLTRVQDDHVAEVAGVEQAWSAEGWRDRFALDLAPDETGYDQDREGVARVVADASLLTGYHDAVHARTTEFLRGLDDAALDRIVDTRWDPPVTLGVRLVSVIDDSMQHAGQAAFVRGIVERR